MDANAAIAATRTLDPATKTAVQAFVDRLAYPPIDVLVFGSRARGDHAPESDIDVAVVHDGPRGDRYEALMALSDVAYDILLETGLRIHPLPLWRMDVDRSNTFSNPALIDAIKRDGLRLCMS